MKLFVLHIQQPATIHPRDDRKVSAFEYEGQEG
jgi:hypothetical protein